ncbi:MucR family transcriptional regulator [Streptomyces noursei]|uniref:MucR family transcriptional regulator n=1 Tax=Streptomyces noursei TaxID=1971 RepID=UPI00380399FF
MTPTPGTQPEEEGRLQCLECGGLYRLLAPHLAQAHHMSTAEYRQAHHLPRRLSLRSADLNERARDFGRALYSARADVRAHLDAGRTRNIDAIREGSRASAHYPMVVNSRRRAAKAKQDLARRRIDEAAQACGYRTIEDYFAARRDRPTTELAAELGISRSRAGEWRSRTRQAVEQITVPRPTLPPPGTPITEQQQQRFLQMLREGIPKHEAASVLGLRTSALRRLRANDAAFCAAWDTARVLKGRPIGRQRPDRDEALRAEWDKGTTVKAIAELLKIPQGSVRYHARALGLPPRRTSTPGKWRERVIAAEEPLREMFAEGLAVTEIAVSLRLPSWAIHRHIRELGLERCRSRAIPLDEHQARRVQEMHDEGASLSSMERELRIGKQRIKRWLENQ